MIGWWTEKLGYLWDVITKHRSPRSLAFGFALGVVLGLVPKGNLIAIVLSVLVLTLKVNVGMAMLAGLAFSWVGVLLDPLSHRIGLALHTAEPLKPLWTKLHNMPIAPWTRFNNTVVLGSTILGALLFYPAYRLSMPWFARRWFAGWKTRRRTIDLPVMQPRPTACRTPLASDVRKPERRKVHIRVDTPKKTRARPLDLPGTRRPAPSSSAPQKSRLDPPQSSLSAHSSGPSQLARPTGRGLTIPSFELAEGTESDSRRRSGQDETDGISNDSPQNQSPGAEP